MILINRKSTQFLECREDFLHWALFGDLLSLVLGWLPYLTYLTYLHLSHTLQYKSRPLPPPFTPNPTPQLGVPPLLPTLSPFTYQYLVLLGTRQLFSALLNMHSSRFHISFYTVCNQSTETTQRGQNNSQCHTAPIEILTINLNGDKRACLLINNVL